jgi:hypothetical protein
MTAVLTDSHFHSLAACFAVGEEGNDDDQAQGENCQAYPNCPGYTPPALGFNFFDDLHFYIMAMAFGANQFIGHFTLLILLF